VSASTSLLRSYAQRERKIVLYIISLSRSEIKISFALSVGPQGRSRRVRCFVERFDFAASQLRSARTGI